MTLATVHPNIFIAACLEPIEGANKDLEAEMVEDAAHVFYVNRMLHEIAEHEFKIARTRRAMSIKGVGDRDTAEAAFADAQEKMAKAFDTLMRTPAPMRDELAAKRKMLHARRKSFWIVNRLDEYNRILDNDDLRLAYRKASRRKVSR